MRVLFATNDYFPVRGGLQASIDTLVHRLSNRGHCCAVINRTTQREMHQPMVLTKRVARKLFNIPILIADKSFPYAVYRTPLPFESLSTVRRDFKPDVMVCVVGGSHTIKFTKSLFKAAGDLPTMIYFFDVEGVALASDPLFARSHVVANAEVIASLIADHLYPPPVIPCIVDANDFQVKTSREVVLYVNPHPRKGENLAWAIATAARGLRFVFQESWRLSEDRRLEISKRAQKLGNVEFRTATDRPAEIYRDARILLAPYGPERPRVVDEAQANGIPVVASDVPGLDENVGTGGVLVDPTSDIDEWVSVLKRLYTDKVYYEELVTNAIRHNRRPEMQSDYLVELFERELRNVSECSRS